MGKERIMAKNKDLTENTAVNKKETKKSKRSVKSIPSMTFEDTIQLATGIWECASGKKVRKLTLFDHLHKSPDSGPSRTLITSSSKYGITTGGYQAEYIELTTIGGIASNPDSNQVESTNAKFKLAIQNNQYFNHLYETFKSMKLPTNKVMEDSVIDFGLNDYEAKQCVETFIVNAKYIGLIQILSGAQRLISIEHLIEEIQQNNDAQILVDDKTSCSDVELNVHTPINNDVSFDKICFYITPIGMEGSEERKHSDMLLECVVSPVLEEFGLSVVRADQIDKPGLITNQILDYITKSKMVIADLSFHNPNVFYELAVRHMKGLPTIHLCRTSDNIPFDISGFRTITLDMTDIYSFVPQLETYKSQISSQLRNLLDQNGEADNPISAYLNK